MPVVGRVKDIHVAGLASNHTCRPWENHLFLTRSSIFTAWWLHLDLPPKKLRRQFDTHIHTEGSSSSTNCKYSKEIRISSGTLGVDFNKPIIKIWIKIWMVQMYILFYFTSQVTIFIFIFWKMLHFYWLVKTIHRGALVYFVLSIFRKMLSIAWRYFNKNSQCGECRQLRIWQAAITDTVVVHRRQ